MKDLSHPVYPDKIFDALVICAPSGADDPESLALCIEVVSQSVLRFPNAPKYTKDLMRSTLKELADRL